MADRYWVGDGGQITDTAHWSTSSGGAGGASVPTFTDNVFFDANSFSTGGQVVAYTAGTDVVTWKSLSFDGVTNSPEFSLQNISLITIFGDLTLDPTVNYSYDGDWKIADNGGVVAETITFNGARLANGDTDFFFKAAFVINNVNDGSSCVIADTISIGNRALWMLGSGTIDVQGDVNAGGLKITNGHGAGLAVSLNAAVITLDPTDADATNAGIDYSSAVAIALDAGTSKIRLINSGHVNLFFTQSGIVTGNFYDIEVEASSSGAGGLTFFHPDFNISINSLKVFARPYILNMDATKVTTIGTLFAHGGSGAKHIQITSGSPGTKAEIEVASASVFFTTVTDSLATGAAAPILDRGGVDGGNTEGWIFDPDIFQQTVQITFADTDGDVQLFNAGRDDNGSPIFYELNTQQVDFGARENRKKIQDRMIIFGKDMEGAAMSAIDSAGKTHQIKADLNARINESKDLSLEGQYFVFRWSGSSQDVTPVFEGIYIEKITDIGITYG